MIRLLVRLAGMLGTLAAMTLVVFALQQLVPNDPARLAAGPNAPEAVVEQRRIELGLRDPVLTQYGGYLWRLLQGDLGRSIRTTRPIAQDLARFLPASAELLTAGMVLGTGLGFAIAILRLVARGGGLFRIAMTAIGSMPIFLIGIGLLMIFWYALGWLPSGGQVSSGTGSGLIDRVRHLALPAATLALPVAVAISRTVHSSLVSVLRQNYVRTAYSKGLRPRQVVIRHGVRNSLRAPLTMMALQFGMVFANLLIVERIYAWPGVGLYMIQALGAADLPAVLGVSLVFGAAYILFNAFTDWAQIWADPRLRDRR